MPALPELTPYPCALEGAVAVGWLAPGERFLRAPPPAALRQALARLEREGARLDDAAHAAGPCPVCGAPRPAVPAPVLVRRRSGWFVASPWLLHLVEAHEYSPPFELVQAIEPEDAAATVRVLEKLDGVRARPAMYFGEARHQPLLNCFEGVLGPALDRQHDTGVRTVLDVRHDGGGVAVTYPALELPAGERLDGRRVLEALLGELWTPGSAWNDGLSLLNAGARRLGVTTTHHGKRYRVEYLRGRLLEPTHALGEATEPGTTFDFELDPFLFGGAVLSARDVELRLWDLALLVPQADVRFQGAPVAPPKDLADALRRRAPASLVPVLHATLEAPVRAAVALTVHAAGGRVETYARGRREPHGPFDSALFEALERRAPSTTAAQAAREHLVALVDFRWPGGATLEQVKAALTDLVLSALPGPGPWWDAVLELGR